MANYNKKVECEAQFAGVYGLLVGSYARCEEPVDGLLRVRPRAQGDRNHQHERSDNSRIDLVKCKHTQLLQVESAHRKRQPPTELAIAPARVALRQNSPKNSGANNVDAMPPHAIAPIKLISGTGFKET